jgi:hypothetical protein
LNIGNLKLTRQIFAGSLYLPTNILLIAFFNYYYTFLQLDPDDVSEQLKRQGASVPLVRPGKSTAAFIKTVNFSHLRYNFCFIIERKGLQKLKEFFYSVVLPSLTDYAKYHFPTSVFIFLSFPLPFLLYKMESNFIIEPSADAAELDLTSIFKVTA